MRAAVNPLDRISFPARPTSLPGGLGKSLEKIFALLEANPAATAEEYWKSLARDGVLSGKAGEGLKTRRAYAEDPVAVR